MRYIFFLLPFICSAQFFTSSGQRVQAYSSGGKLSGSSIFVNAPAAPETPEITLSTLKAFPSAFGAADTVRVDPSTATIYEVTNLNTSGAGSFRNAVSQTGERIIIIKVEGLCTDNTDLQLNGATYGNVAIWGQFAPGLGYTYRHSRFSFRDAGNFIFRHITLQGDLDVGCTPNVDCFDPLNFYDLAEFSGYYIDHCSFRYGLDQTWTVSMTNDEGQQEDSYVGSFVYNLLAEADPDHNTASIINVTDIADQGIDIGNHTWSRNMTYNISHRFPNINGEGEFENYNNLIVNWKIRMNRSNTPAIMDFHRNRYKSGGATSVGGDNRNFLNQGSNWGVNEPSIFSAYNIVDGINTNDADDTQDDLWLWWDTESETYYGVNVVEDGPVPVEFFTTTIQHGWNLPADGLWDASDVQSKITVGAGHNRGINTNGTPYYGYDDKDSSYITKTNSNTEESTYRATGAWDNSTFPGTTLYTDTDGDHMPDWFEDQFAFLDKNSSSDMLTTSNVTWDFSAIGAAHNYIVTNNAGYTNLEICAAFYAGDFETMLDGTNNLNIGDE